MSFFRKSETGLDQISHQVIAMMSDARHSFDLASAALLGGADASGLAADIATTDQRINRAEQRLRSELVVHVSVRGSSDIGMVLGYTLLIKKIERIGDQAKNIFDLAVEGVVLAGSADVGELIEIRQQISQMYLQVNELLVRHDDVAAREFVTKTRELNDYCERRVLEFLKSEEPGHWAVPRAMLFRYWKRIVANLGGIVTTSIEPVQPDDDTNGFDWDD